MRRLTFAALAAALFVVPAAPAQAANRWIQKKAPLNIAHQGGEDEFPSNTIYAFRKAVRTGADMLELDIGVTKDNKVIVMHDTTVDGKTNGHGTVASKTLAQIKRLDAAYWFAPKGDSHYSHDLARSAYKFRGVATGRRKPPKGFKAADFRVPTLREVMRAFPKTPINVEIKGRTPKEATSEYLRNADVLAKLLKGTKRRDLIVVSFQQPAVDRFHKLVPASTWLRGSPGPRSGSWPAAHPARAWPPSRCRSPTRSAGWCCRSPRRRTWHSLTARATPGRTGSRMTTPTHRAPGGA